MENLRFSSEQRRLAAIRDVADSHNRGWGAGDDAAAAMLKIQDICNADIELNASEEGNLLTLTIADCESYRSRQRWFLRLIWFVLDLKSIYRSGYCDGWKVATTYEETIWGCPKSRYKGACQGTLTEAD